MRKLVLLSLLALTIVAPAEAQTVPNANVVSSCASASYPAGASRPVTQDTTGNLCTGSTTTPSGTQDVNLKQVGGTTTLTGAGAAGAGSPRTTVAQDPTTVAGSPSLPAGTNAIGKLNPSTYASSAALAANKVVKAVASTLLSFNVGADSTLSGAAWWVMIYDAASAPTDGSVTPVKCYPVPSGTTGISGAWTGGGLTFTTGIVIGVSTTGCFTKTESTHAFISGDAL